ncbi:MAG: DNA phosphorothioation-associated protein 4 [Sphingomonas sp.]|uniref:DNA phosphorothioation-associated protein 4 n=1 Tax=Sphingomonas sp. TaxID=28214 RepID=UPI0035A94728|nr:DNA phosphorothioation-associated protein 4 [Sphingomonas sp.]
MADRAPNINRSKLHEDLVQRLSMQNIPGSDRKLFPTIRELLCFAALLGFSEERRVPLDRSAGVEDISYQQFERDPAAEDLLWTIAVAETQDTEVLREGEEARCAEIFEEYANGGLALIKDFLLRNGGEYPDRALMALLKERKYLQLSHAEPDLAAIKF